MNSQPQKEPVIFIELMKLKEEIGKLIEVVGGLSNRLQPVRLERPEQEEKCPSEVEPALSPLGQELFEQRKRVEYVRKDLVQLMLELEL